MNKYIKRFYKAQKGITGLETAILLIAFVVVASVFAYTVLSAGVFSSEKGKEAIHAGLEQARGSMELVGPIMVTGVAADTLDDADDNWTASTNVTAALDSSDRKQGSGSVDLTVAAAFTTGLIAYEDLSSAINVSDHYSARLWVKTNTNVAAGAVRLVLDDTSACSSALETISLPALNAADGWTQVQVKYTTPSALTAVLCVGLTANSDPGAVVLGVDFVEAPGEATAANIIVANALNGEPINLTTTSDADADGIISDEGTKTHFLSIAYSDSTQRVEDVTWTKTQIGNGDSDNILEAGEKFQITISLIGASPLPVGYTNFGLHLRPQKGASVTLERSLPAVITTNMDLR